MARAETRTLLPLDSFFSVIGMHPLLGNQVTVEDITPDDPTCGVPLVQHAWQDSDRVGREEIAVAVSNAELLIAGQLGFTVLPTWQVAERLQYPRPRNAALYAAGMYDVRGAWNTVQTQWGNVISGGVETKTLIVAGAAVVYSDPDGDGYKERATITVTVPATVTNPEEVAVYYPGLSADDSWEIRPITVTITAGIATIVCQRAQLVLKSLLDKMKPVPVNGLIDGNFLTTVDVYRHWNDPQTQVEFAWNDAGCVDFTGTYSTQAGAISVQNAALGIVAVSPGVWNATDNQFDWACPAVGHAPDRLRAWYYAGWQRNGGSVLVMDLLWQRAVSFFALTLLDRPLCRGNAFTGVLGHWREDLALRATRQAQGTSYAISDRILGNPFGTMRGAVYAWEQVLRYSTLEVGSV